jgi:hypothetical protein
MISQECYSNHLKEIAEKFGNVNINWGIWYAQYVVYELMYDNYLLAFIQEYAKKQERPCINIVFWESCPGDMPFPHQNYAFDSSRYNNLYQGRYDTYLRRVCNKFGVSLKVEKMNKTIGDLMIELASKGILIIDLYPTHGVCLSKKNRTNLFNKVFPSYSIEKLKRVGNLIMDFDKCETIRVTSELWNSGLKNRMSNNLKGEIKRALFLNGVPKFEVIGQKRQGI